MRVLFLTDSLSDFDGVGRYTIRLIKAMEELSADLEVEVLLARKHRPTSVEVPARWDVRIGLPPDYFYYMSPARSLANRLRYLPGVVRAARRADVVHAIKDFPHNDLALQAARLAGRPCVATGHGTYTIQPLLSERYARRARRTYAGFAGMISVSNYTRKRLVDVLGDKDPLASRVRVIPNAVNAEHYVAAREVGERPWHGERFTLAIGELKERKGHHLSLAAWLRAAADFPDLHHYVVGKLSGDEYEQSLKRMVADAGCTDRVHWLGNIDEDEKVDLLQRAEVFVHTPVTAADGGFEGFGIVYLEASACGTPALGTLACGAEDAIVDGVTGRLVSQDVDAVHAALVELLSDADARARMGENGRRHARSASWADNARRVLELYDEVLAR
ncbi:MAG: glycosyltransferase family 4 protein [Planctomycetes bacterium]|nr:glycosyltransferase family 4 protein [Planctomycetota bacterium]MCB9904168.1 glycosyltransferase family 4 protein [Planctomycetota bacterium]